MAKLSVKAVDFREVTFNVSDLEYVGKKYDKFVFRIYQNDIQIIRYTENDMSWCDTKSFNYTLSNSEYLGNNWLSPDCNYVAYVDCYWKGMRYTLNSVSFKTDSISPPTGNITPSVYVPVRKQEYGSCVADCLACAMDIFKAKNTGITYEKFSSAYIFGSDGASKDWMYFEEAVDNCISYGSPRYEIFSGFFPDTLSKAEAVKLFNSADEYVTGNAKKQKLTGKQNVDFYDCETVKSCIESYGFFMLNIRVPNNFYDVDESGIVPQPDSYSGENHSIALIGLTTKNGKKHWIAQNSWSEHWGAGGRCFIPYDWGCGVQSPLSGNSDEPTSWTMDCYSVKWGSAYTKSNPEKPYNINIQQIGVTKSVQILLECDDTVDRYFVLAKKNGSEKSTNRWHIKAKATNKSAKITFDEYGSYDIAIIAVKNDYCSDISDIVRAGIFKSSRPDNFYWTYPKIKGEAFNLTHDEWNSFTARINEFRKYLNERTSSSLPDYDFSEAIKGEEFKSSMYREAVVSMKGMVKAYGDSDIAKSLSTNNAGKGDPITSDLMNILVEALNSIKY